MRETLQQRLESLRTEYEAGQKMLADLNVKRENLSATLLRIEGAMQVLRELLSAEEGVQPGNGAATLAPSAGS